MSQVNFSQSISKLAGTLSFIALMNCLAAKSADAFSINGGSNLTNGGFEQTIDGANPTNGWSTTGDVTTIIANEVQAAGTAVNPVSGNSQAILTTAYNNLGGTARVDDVESLAEGEMGPAAPLNFNQSGTNPVDADTDPNNHTGDDLQTFLGLDTNSLSIEREPAVSGVPRTSKEGSALLQNFTVEITQADVDSGNNAFEISFNWAYLTNDGFDDGGDGSFPGGNQDYGFFTLYEDSDTAPGLTLLGDSSGTISEPIADNNYNSGDVTYYNSESIYTQTVMGLAAGTYNYTIGFGVVDIDGSGRSSALLLDNLGIKQVPFQFSPSGGIALVISFFCFHQFLRRCKK